MGEWGDECKIKRRGLTASAVLRHVRPRAIGQALPDLGPHDHPVASADVLYLVIHWQDLHTADLWEKETLKHDRCSLVLFFSSSSFFPPLDLLGEPRLFVLTLTRRKFHDNIVQLVTQS